MVIVSTLGAETPALQIIMSSGPLWSCEGDNQGQRPSLCSLASVVIYRLIPAISPDTDYYSIYFTVEGGTYISNRAYSTGGTYITEVFAGVDIQRPASFADDQYPWPGGGCTDGSASKIQTWGTTFSPPGIDGCTELSTVSTADRLSINWHLCGGIPNCPYSAISRDYTGFLFSMTAPKGESPAFTVRTKTTVAKPSGCCLRDLLATGEVIWSPQSSAKSALNLPPPPQFIGQWYLIASVAIIPFAVPFLTRKTSGRIPSTPRPEGVGVLAVIGLALGSFVLVAAWNIPPPSFVITTHGYPIAGFIAAVAIMASALGIWLGQEWARLLTIALNSLSVVPSLLNLLSFNPLQWLASLLSILVAAYIISYMVRPDVRRFCSRPTTGIGPVSTNSLA